jgi:hypothetical protein
LCTEKRRAEAARIREKYPDRIPVRDYAFQFLWFLSAPINVFFCLNYVFFYLLYHSFDHAMISRYIRLFSMCGLWWSKNNYPWSEISLILINVCWMITYLMFGISCCWCWLMKFNWIGILTFRDEITFSFWEETCTIKLNTN